MIEFSNHHEYIGLTKYTTVHLLNRTNNKDFWITRFSPDTRLCLFLLTLCSLTPIKSIGVLKEHFCPQCLHKNL